MSNHSIRVSIVSLATAIVFTGTMATAQYRVSGAEVVVVCPLTIGGSFEARTKDVRGEVASSAESPSSMEGTLRVNLQSLETGIGVRDRHMRDTYLEVQKGPEYAEATIEQIHIDKLEGKTSFSGTLLLHGQRHEVTGTAELKPQGSQIRVQAQFPIKVSEFAIAEPIYLGVGVRDEIQVKVTMMIAASDKRAASAASSQQP
jgi:polyisoprenoid-binding protein YceI